MTVVWRQKTAVTCRVNVACTGSRLCRKSQISEPNATKRDFLHECRLLCDLFLLFWDSRMNAELDIATDPTKRRVWGRRESGRLRRDFLAKMHSPHISFNRYSLQKSQSLCGIAL